MSSRSYLDLDPAPSMGNALAEQGGSNPAGHGEYRRRARRLRCQLADRPARLQSALGDLARQEDARHDPNSTVGRFSANRPVRYRVGNLAHGMGAALGWGPMLGVAPASAVRLGRLVQESLTDGTLPYSRRQGVLRLARRLGVGRFQANLLIAAVQHRSAVPADVRETRPARGHSGWGVAITIAALVETAIVVCAWWIARA